MQNIGFTEIVVIGVILIVLFGAKKITELGKNAGEATKELKKIKKEVSSAMTDVDKDVVEGEGVEEK